MTNRILTTVSFLGLASLGAILAPSLAEAQCRPDDIFCAELRIGPAQPPPPPPPVVVTPPPPPVVVVPPPPQQPPPPPPVVIVQPARPQPPPPPPQVVVVTRPQPQAQVIQVQRRRVTRTQLVPDFDLGLHVNLAGMVLGEESGMGGVQVGFRLRPNPHIGLDLSVGAFGGQSFQYEGNGGDRWEVPLLADVMFFLNPQHRVQFYFVVGVGTSIAEQQFARGGSRDFVYVGGEAGLGLEFRIGRHFAINLDLRGFVREQVGEGRPEFERVTEAGTVQSTNTSGGMYGTAGMTFYFGG